MNMKVQIFFIDKEIVNLIFEKYKKSLYSISKLSKLSKSYYRLYLECEKKLIKKN